MNHLLNICNINGAEVEPVDVIIGGSPCQDLSVAGKRAGLDGERSGLFMEQIRIIKEMRNADNGNRPRYMVWENVPGALSSNKGEDFRVVLEETAKIADETAVIPRPDKGKWANAGAIMGDGWSIAWRVFDAQFWGVPQRRCRIALVADFGGQSAPEILFERESVSGDIAESGAQGEGVAGGFEGGAGAAGFKWGQGAQSRSIGWEVEKSPTLPSVAGGNTAPAVIAWTYRGRETPSKNQGGMAVVCMNPEEVQSKRVFDKEGIAPTISGAEGGGKCCVNVIQSAVYDTRGNGDGAIAPTMTGDHQNRVTDYTAICLGNGQVNQTVSEVAGALNCMHDQQIVAAVDCRNGTENPYINGALQAKPNGGTSYNLQNTVRTHQSVRRLTPLECERLQGYEDNWTNIPPQTEVTVEDLSFWRTVWDEWDDINGKKHHTDKQIIKWLQSEPADSARYKALGNSIALPPWRFVLSRIHKQGARTMASLFDGIGGFPKIWQELGGQTLWASEVEPFPIAVTKYHFKEVHNGK